MILAPALTLSTMAAASSTGVALRDSPFPAAASAKIGRANSVQSGQMADADDPRLA